MLSACLCVGVKYMMYVFYVCVHIYVQVSICFFFSVYVFLVYIAPNSQ